MSTHSFRNEKYYLLKVYHVPATVPGIGDTALNEIDIIIDISKLIF